MRATQRARKFASGNYGLLQSALDYQNDTAAPVVGTDVTSDGKGTYAVKFTSSEAASIYYTTDGSTPTLQSTEWKPPRARALPLPLDLAPKTKLQWIAKDFKGNVSAVKSQVLGQTDTPGTVGGTVPATLALTMGAPASSARSRPAWPRSTRRARPRPSSRRPVTRRSASPTRARTTRAIWSTARFALPQPLQGLGTIKTWTAPTSNESVPITFKQSIGGQRAAAHRHVQQDADVHPEHHDPVALRQGVGRVVIRPTPWSHLRGQSDSYVRLPPCADVHVSLRIGAASEGFRGFQRREWL